MEKINIINKKKVVACVCVFLLIIFIIVLIVILSKDEPGINALVLKDDVKLYSKPIESEKIIKDNIYKNTEVKIIDSIVEENIEWKKVKVNGKKGFVLSKNIDYFCKDNIEKTIVADFSEHNFKDVFKNKNDVEAFLLKYNISYVYIRAGGRGYGEKGNFYTDKKYKDFKNACEYLGIEYGYYFLDEALNNSEIISEVEFIDDFMRKNKSKLLSLPVVLDVEEHEGNGRCDDIWDKRVNLVSKLIKKVEQAGYKTLLYSNANTCNTYLSSLNSDLWLAYYPQENFIPDYWYSKTDQPATQNKKIMKQMVGWQFTENGVDHVIKENIDLSIFKEDFMK